MKRMHMPRIDPRYWLAITLASIFGTNLGDLYAHDSGLGILPGLALLAVLAALVFGAERADRRPHEVYYWAVIIIIRTGATNIADWLQFKAHIPQLALSIGLAALMAVLAWRATQLDARHGAEVEGGELPDTGAVYWSAMLTAGVFGTVVGDYASHNLGQEIASLGLGALLAVALFAWRKTAATTIALYWVILGIARSAGTAIGDLIAENPRLDIGLPIATLMTGTAFVAVLMLWRSRGKALVAA